MNRAGDITVMFSKKELLTKLKDNRASHQGIFAKAWEGYRKAVIAELEEKLELLKANKPVQPFSKHSAPEDHTSDYDDVIDMLDWSLGDEVELTQAQFRQYVKDDWGWKQTWTTSNSVYLPQ